MGYVRTLIDDHYTAKGRRNILNRNFWHPVSPVLPDFHQKLKETIESDNQLLATAGLAYSLEGRLIELKCEITHDKYPAIIILKNDVAGNSEIMGAFVQRSGESYMGDVSVDLDRGFFSEQEAYPLMPQHIEIQIHNNVIRAISNEDRALLGGYVEIMDPAARHDYQAYSL